MGEVKARRAPSLSRQPGGIAQQAEETLVHIRTLWRDLFRNPLAEAAEHGLTGPQVTVMTCLVNRGSMTVTELSGLIGMSHSTASGIIDRLEARGLVRRSPDAKDQRRTAIAVTDMVTRYVRELEAGPSGRLASALAMASADQRRAISKGLETLRAILDRPPSAAAEGRSPAQRASVRHRARAGDI
jgi:DNA-binding MarR family transcriptional regulator